MKRITPINAIRKPCLFCCNDLINEIRACPVLNCNLWKFRLNIHPFTEKNVNNPFLNPDNFKESDNFPALEVIERINSLQK